MKDICTRCRIRREIVRNMEQTKMCVECCRVLQIPHTDPETGEYVDYEKVPVVTDEGGKIGRRLRTHVKFAKLTNMGLF